MAVWHSRSWSDWTSEAFSRLDRERLIAVLPVAATEQHGPHLPMSTDLAIIDGVVAATVPKLPDDLPVLFLPTLAYGKSNEHSRYPGTLTLSASTLISAWMDIGASVARSGVKKLVLLNSHGGQQSAMDIVARDLREAHGLMCVAANWYSLGLPEGLFSARELKHGIHAGDIETSLMLALAPQTVKPERAKDFHSLTEDLASQNRFLSITPSGKLGWQTQDLNPEGACGDATLASADKGRAVLDFVSSRVVELLQEVHAFDLRRLHNEPAWK
jgi:creatinine amidohydrolase